MRIVEKKRKKKVSIVLLQEFIFLLLSDLYYLMYGYCPRQGCESYRKYARRYRLEYSRDVTAVCVQG